MEQGKGNGERLALLIDAENMPATFAAAVVAKVRTLGSIATARAYGHFDNDKLKAWRTDEIGGLGIVRVNVSQANVRKNSADFKLVIEAMDMVHTRQLDGFCIASSDGDFSSLAERIRASAFTLYLFGQAKAPSEYRKLGHAFFDVATLAKPVATPPPAARLAPSQPRRAPPAKRAPSPRPPTAKVKAAAPAEGAKAAIPLERIHVAIANAAGEDGWASSQKIGNALAAADRSFKVKTYAANMKQLLGRTSGVEIKKDGSATYARLKR